MAKGMENPCPLCNDSGVVKSHESMPAETNCPRCAAMTCLNFSFAERDVLTEREHQTAKFPEKGDDKFTKGELARGSVAKALHAVESRLARSFWPPNLTCRDPFNGTPRQLLVEAAAMLVAEIERMDRAAGGKAL